jgi:hypothetical protein
MRNRFAIPAVLVSALFLGCGGGSKKTTTAGATGAGNGAAPEKVPEKKASITYALFPADSTFVLGVTGEKLRNSKLVADKLAMITGAMGPQLDKLKGCGIDLLGKLDTLVVAMNQPAETGIAVVRGFTLGQISGCASKDSRIEYRQEGPLHVLTKGNESVYGAWLDSDTAVWSQQKAHVEKAVAGSGGLDKNPAMSGLLDKIDTSAAVYLAMQIPSAKSQTPLGTIKGAFGSVYLDAGLNLKAGMTMADANMANTASSMINGQLGNIKAGPFGPLLAGLSIAPKGTDLGIDLTLTAEQINQLIEMVKTNPMIQMVLKGALGGSTPAPPPPPPAPPAPKPTP